MEKFLSITIWFPTITLLVARQNANSNLTPAIVQVAYTFTVILCQEWNRVITRKYQSILH